MAEEKSRNRSWTCPIPFTGLTENQPEKAVPFGLQHVLAMFVANIAPHPDRYRA